LLITATSERAFRAARRNAEAAFLLGRHRKSSETLVVEDNDHDQETRMPLRQATPSQLGSIKQAISRLGERGDAGRALRDFLAAQLDPDNADQSIRCAMKNLEGAVREMRDELRAIMY
jgi:hypothetical protein